MTSVKILHLNRCKRIDFIISGLNAKKREQIIIIELKQWDDAEPTQKPGIVVTRFQHGKAEVAHPSYQAWSYAQLIRDYNQEVQDREIKLFPCACLHNYIRHKDDPLDAEQYQDYLDEAPAYTKGQLNDLRDFIKKSIKKGRLSFTF